MYYNLLPKLKNAIRAKKASLVVPYSKMDLAIARVLVLGGYLGDVQKKTTGRRGYLEIKLAKGKSPINDFKIISKPSRRIYFDYRNLKPVKHGYGVGVVSTSKGIMSVSEAKKNKVGGEYLFEIW